MWITLSKENGREMNLVPLHREGKCEYFYCIWIVWSLMAHACGVSCRSSSFEDFSVLGELMFADGTPFISLV